MTTNRQRCADGARVMGDGMGDIRGRRESTEAEIAQASQRVESDGTGSSTLPGSTNQINLLDLLLYEAGIRMDARGLTLEDLPLSEHGIDYSIVSPVCSGILTKQGACLGQE